MIIFKKIKIRNFLSFGNIPIEIDLNSNKKTIIYGSNGSGKSVILDAICFVLFGKAFRKINKNNINNSINKRDCFVEICFNIRKY